MIDVKIVCENKKYMPEYATEFDACMDLKVKIDSMAFWDYTIQPSETKVFGTGIQVSIPNECVMLIYPRSSTGIKLHCMLANTTAVIDSGYRDEIKIAITNFGNKSIELEDGQRVAQFMVIPRPKINLVQVQDDENFREGDRGGGIGSTGSN